LFLFFCFFLEKQPILESIESAIRIEMEQYEELESLLSEWENPGPYYGIEYDTHHMDKFELEIDEFHHSWENVEEHNDAIEQEEAEGIHRAIRKQEVEEDTYAAEALKYEEGEEELGTCCRELEESENLDLLGIIEMEIDEQILHNDECVHWLYDDEGEPTELFWEQHAIHQVDEIEMYIDTWIAMEERGQT